MNPAQIEAHQSAAIEAIKELLDANFIEAEKSTDDNGKFTISFRVAFDRSHPQTHLKVTSRISKSVTDEIETNVPDPDQMELGLVQPASAS